MGILSARAGAARLIAAASAVFVALTGVTVHPQDPTEYQVKAVYLFNFVKFVTWPDHAKPETITICVAEPNPFGEALNEAIKGESVGDRRLETRVIRAPQSDCQVVFVPHGTNAAPYLDAARDAHTLTVGEDARFLSRGGIINFIHEGGSVRFEISPSAAARADLRISAHLMRLARGRGRQD